MQDHDDSDPTAPGIRRGYVPVATESRNAPPAPAAKSKLMTLLGKVFLAASAFVTASVVTAWLISLLSGRKPQEYTGDPIGDPRVSDDCVNYAEKAILMSRMISTFPEQAPFWAKEGRDLLNTADRECPYWYRRRERATADSAVHAELMRR